MWEKILDRMFGRKQPAAPPERMQFNIAAGDTVVLSYSNFLSREQRDRFKEMALADLPADVKVMVLEGGIQMSVLNRADAPNADAAILGQLTVQTKIMAAYAKRADRDSKDYQDTRTAYAREKDAAVQAELAAAKELQVGDKVMLKSGGPVMTVVYIPASQSMVMCEWTNEKGVNRSPFCPANLRPVEFSVIGKCP